MERAVWRAIVLTIGSAAFSWFVRSFASLPITYGSLSTVVAFMLWLLFTVTLAGAELDAAIDWETKPYACEWRRKSRSGWAARPCGIAR
jgi:uncharacterized BrkB/YihY/UPF0761 family membrane protein